MRIYPVNLGGPQHRSVAESPERLQRKKKKKEDKVNAYKSTAIRNFAWSAKTENQKHKGFSISTSNKKSVHT